MIKLTFVFFSLSASNGNAACSKLLFAIYLKFSHNWNS